MGSDFYVGVIRKRYFVIQRFLHWQEAFFRSDHIIVFHPISITSYDIGYGGIAGCGPADDRFPLSLSFSAVDKISVREQGRCTD